MAGAVEMETLTAEYIQKGDHGGSDYFGLIKELVKRRNRFARAEREYAIWQEEIDRIYELVRDEILTNQARPRTPVKFGTSGWR
ncbi:MAG: phosphoglucomutase, partial [Desulfobulbaceae bacterium]|nr:phosphoglucomutase [Desulfobulbaceae bacterium]